MPARHPLTNVKRSARVFIPSVLRHSKRAAPELERLEHEIRALRSAAVTK